MSSTATPSTNLSDLFFNTAKTLRSLAHTANSRGFDEQGFNYRIKYPQGAIALLAPPVPNRNGKSILYVPNEEDHKLREELATFVFSLADADLDQLESIAAKIESETGIGVVVKYNNAAYALDRVGIDTKINGIKPLGPILFGESMVPEAREILNRLEEDRPDWEKYPPVKPFEYLLSTPAANK